MLTDVLKADRNYFNLLRLFAALQVTFFHFDYFVNPIKNNDVLNFVKRFLWFFPGVNIFYFISGFLIWHSITHLKGNIRSFYFNRFMRIYPGLWAALLFSVLALAAFGQLTDISDYLKPFSLWLIGQMTLFQYYTPAFLRDYGCGTPNGVLWTVIVEVQFYLLAPFLFLIINKIKSITLQNTFLLVLAAISFFFNQYEERLGLPLTLYKIFYFSVFNFFYLFCIGILVYLNLNKLQPLFKKGLYLLTTCLIMLALVCSVYNVQLNRYEADWFSLCINLLLASVVFSFAFSRVEHNVSFFDKNDFSYGLYLYHMPIVNILLVLSISNYASLVFWITAITFAIMSWYCIEKPFLKRKHLHYAR